MDTLPDLRVTIAESMYALADRIPATSERENDRALRLIEGANTLRWCAAREVPSVEELKAEVENLTEQLEDAELIAGELVDNVRYAASKWKHTETCATILAAPVDVECSCGMAKMRKSVLDVVESS